MIVAWVWESKTWPLAKEADAPHPDRVSVAELVHLNDVREYRATMEEEIIT